MMMRQLRKKVSPAVLTATIVSAILGFIYVVGRRVQYEGWKERCFYECPNTFEIMVTGVVAIIIVFRRKREIQKRFFIYQEWFHERYDRYS